MRQRPPNYGYCSLNHADIIAREIVLHLLRVPLPLSDEKILQNHMHVSLKDVGYDFAREVKMSIGIIDFLVSGCVGIEVKIGGRKRDIWRQCSGYLKDPRIQHLIVATSTPLSFPAHESGKPVTMVSLARAWL